MTTIRVATYNVLMGGQRGQLLNEAVRSLRADVLLVNESPKTPVLWRRRCERLTERWGMSFVAGGRPAGSNMIAVTPALGIKDSGSLTISQPWLQPRRGVAWAQLSVAGRLFGAVSCHLSLTAQGRAREVEEVIQAASRLRGPVIVAGDLNETPTGPSWRRLKDSGFSDSGSVGWPTFPAHEPRKRIDALLVRGSMKVLSHGDPGVPTEMLKRASDHLPVLAVLELL